MSGISPGTAAVKDVAHPVVGTPDNAETINGHVNGAAAKAGDLETLCRDLERQVDGFLDRRIDDNNVLRSTQEQVRVARGVIDEALRRYRYGIAHFILFPPIACTTRICSARVSP